MPSPNATFRMFKLMVKANGWQLDGHVSFLSVHLVQACCFSPHEWVAHLQCWTLHNTEPDVHYLMQIVMYHYHYHYALLFRTE